MKMLIGWLAVAVVAFFAIFIVKRILSLAFRRRRKPGASGPVATREIHDEIVDVAEDVAAAGRIAAAFATAAAFFAAPAGLMALAVGFGFMPAPLIVRILPVLVAFALGSAAVSAAAKLYAKKRRAQGGRTASQ